MYSDTVVPTATSIAPQREPETDRRRANKTFYNGMCNYTFEEGNVHIIKNFWTESHQIWIAHSWTRAQIYHGSLRSIDKSRFYDHFSITDQPKKLCASYLDIDIILVIYHNLDQEQFDVIYFACNVANSNSATGYVQKGAGVMAYTNAFKYQHKLWKLIMFYNDAWKNTFQKRFVIDQRFCLCAWLSQKLWWNGST